MEKAAMAVIKKKAKNERRTIVFADESGLTEKPHRVRTWSPRGQTPVLQYHFSWKNLSVIAGITVFNFYFRMYPGAIKAPQIIQFLEHLMHQIPGKILLIWDRLPGHRSRAVGEFVAKQRGRLVIEFLPAYAPELNPTEYIWGYLKKHALPNFCPQNFNQLKTKARRSLRNMRRRPTLITAFWQQAELPF
jgi:transposase